MIFKWISLASGEAVDMRDLTDDMTLNKFHWSRQEIDTVNKRNRT